MSRRELPRPNPFSPTAVARVSDIDPAAVTIETPPVLMAETHLASYLSADPRQPGNGQVLALVGEYGSGKTHLAVRLLHLARRSPTVKAMYVDAPADRFEALYHRFVERLDRDDVRVRVRQYYADIVADSLPLQTPGFSDDVGPRLRDGSLDPDEVISLFGLTDASFLLQVREKLGQVTQNEAFGTALMLLIRPGFDTVVWDWLAGHRPDQLLVERGITTQINTETAALEALGVFALLFGHRGQRFVLILDELDKVLSSAAENPEESALSLRGLLDVFEAADAFLVLAGVPEFLEMLGAGTRQRINRVVEMSPLTVDDTMDFIKRTQQKVLQTAELAPFTPDTVAELVQLARGRARDVIRLCHHVYREAPEDGSDVTPELVRKVARDRVGFASAHEIRNEVRRILDADGWPYFRNYALGRTRSAMVDYWIAVGDQGAGCALLLAEALSTEEDVDAISRRVAAVQAAAANSETLLVVIGYLAPDAAQVLTDTYHLEPLVYDRRSFASDLPAAVKAMIRRLESAPGEDTFAQVRERVERISRQQSNTHSYLSQLAQRLDSLQTSADRQLTTIQRELELLGQSMTQPAVADRLAGHAPRPLFLPEQVTALFTDALSKLDGLDRLDALLRDAFVGDRPRSGVQLRGRLRAPDAGDVLAAIGVAVTLNKLVEAFRDAVGDWYRSDPVQRNGEVRADATDRLNELCGHYDEMFELIPLYRLELLADLTTTMGTDEDDLVERSARPARQADVRDRFEGLGARVRRDLLAALAG